MQRSKRTIIRRILWVAGSFVAISLATFLLYFPGQQTGIAFTLASGVNVKSLQARIDALEEKAIQKKEMLETERRFLLDLYTCFAKGGALVAPQSSKMMHRYLSRTGDPLAIPSRLFTLSAPVQDVMDEMRKEVRENIDHGSVKDSYSSETFYMGDPKYFDSFVGLYFGTLTVSACEIKKDSVVLCWRAEVPWTWPTYEELFQKYGNHHAQNFPLPNARSLIQGSKYCLRMDDGLGGHLSTIGLAKPFLVYSEWKETIPRSAP